ncbi:MAG: regulatory protein marr [Frankiales bacterium]|nr:regulatory protein marr [Frankiales bacterium]
MSTSQLQALLALEHRGPLNLTRFADALNVIPSSASRLCDRLVAADLVTRTPAETDRREVVLQLTSNGRKLVRQIRRLRREALDVALEQMGPRDRVSLLKGLTALGALLNEERDADEAGAAHG